MINKTEIDSFLFKCNLKNYTIIPIPLGGNNQIYKIQTENNFYILKKYFLDQQNRFQREINFLNILQNNGINNVPQILEFDEINQIILMSWIDGKRVKNITLDDIYQTLTFIKEINRIPNLTEKKINAATDSGTRYLDHYNNVKSRIHKLESFLFDSPIFPGYGEAVEKIKFLFKKIETDYDYESKKMILSPSDFGFHNILKNNKKLYFIDFEYAGWDDPIKMCCDFFLQPKIPVSKEFLDVFIENISPISEITNFEFKLRFNKLLPLCSLKWACIAVNVLDPALLNKRVLSTKFDRKLILESQLAQANSYLNNFQI